MRYANTKVLFETAVDELFNYAELIGGDPYDLKTITWSLNQALIHNISRIDKRLKEVGHNHTQELWGTIPKITDVETKQDLIYHLLQHELALNKTMQDVSVGYHFIRDFETVIKDTSAHLIECYY